MNYTHRINQAIVDCYRDGTTDPEQIKVHVLHRALGGDETLQRQLEDYIEAATELAAMLAESNQ